MSHHNYPIIIEFNLRTRKMDHPVPDTKHWASLLLFPCECLDRRHPGVVQDAGQARVGPLTQQNISDSEL